MSDVPPKKDAFAVLMANATRVCPPDDPWYTAVIYEAHLEHVDPEKPLWRVPYIGQVVRVGTAEQNFEKRKRQHETKATRDSKDLGFHAIIGMYGADKIAWRIVSSKSGRRSEVQAWANAEEIRLIGEHGGVLRDMDAKLQQTLNLTKGGQGDPAVVWAGIEARRRRALAKFKAAMEAYVAEHGSALVPKAYVDDDGYRLGAQLNKFRQGRMRKGMSNEADITAWAEALPKWHWNARESDEWREEKVKHGKEQWANASEERKAEWRKANKDAQNRPEVHTKHVQFRNDWWANATEEKKADRSTKHKKTLATAEFKAKRSNLATHQHATERRAELKRARLIALPFVKSQKRRKKMRAASTDTKSSGRRGENVLYMFSEDGKTIRRVQKSGLMGRDNIVGPVVDPPVAEAAGPSDLNAAYVSDSD